MLRIIDCLSTDFWEHEYLDKVTFALRDLPLPDGLTVVVTNDKIRLPVVPDDSVIVILVSDEYYGVPPYARQVLAVFKQYAPELPAANVRPMPLGCANKFPRLRRLPMGERLYDTVFSGFLHNGRSDFTSFLRRFAVYPQFQHSYIHATNGFGRGLPMSVYAGLLYNSRIALCPAGAHGPESFRVFEALNAGCVVITPKKPSTWFYDGWPAIEVPDWSSAEHLIEFLLSDSAFLNDLHHKHYQWWDRVCAEPQVAMYIANEIGSLLARKAVPHGS